MDATRGVAILLLLIWHASAVPVLYGLEMSDAVRAANAFFFPYRMPTLMLLSGMLLAKSLRKPLPTYYASKFAMIVWPYVIWVVIARMTFFDNDGMTWWHWRGWYASTYLWFLFFIAVYYLVAPAFRRLPPWVPIALAAVVSLLLPQGTKEQELAYFAVFFFAGSWLGERPEILHKLRRPAITAALAAAVLLLGVASTMWTDELHYAVWTAPVSIAATLLLAIFLSQLKNNGGRLLQFFGRSSLVYYVSHFPVMALLSLWLVGSIGSIPLALVNAAAALVVGTALALAAGRIPVAWLFRAPQPLARFVERSLAVVLPGDRRT